MSASAAISNTMTQVRRSMADASCNHSKRYRFHVAIQRESTSRQWDRDGRRDGIEGYNYGQAPNPGAALINCLLIQGSDLCLVGLHCRVARGSGLRFGPQPVISTLDRGQQVTLSPPNHPNTLAIGVSLVRPATSLAGRFLHLHG